MSVQDSFVQPISPCLAPGFTFPSIGLPGMPNFALGCFLSTFAGINFILQFIPPNPSNLPSFPSIDLFLKAFLSGISLPNSYPGFSFGPLSIPAVGSPPYKYDLSGELKLMAVCIVLPFQLIIKMVTGILNLQVNIPTFDLIHSLFIQLSLSLGLTSPSVAQFGFCLAESIANLFTSLI